MPSLISGFEHDVFISYRQNDNRSGWVTEFVKSLQEELEATIKEPVSVYFDTNPAIGLLEAYQVDQSLQGKLKSAIFIPVLSQTYCDPKSFAWVNEFCAFNKLAGEDAFGRDIRVGNGNVVSRILPVKIHDLDPGDTGTIETEIGGKIRAIEFVYREPGVNRPLKPADNRSQNLSKTDYTNQVNKVAHVVKEILGAMRADHEPMPGQGQGGTERMSVKLARPPMKKVWFAGGVIFLLMIAAFAWWMANDEFIETEKSKIAILPFRDVSVQKNEDEYGIGMASEVRTKLSESKQFDFITSIQSTVNYLNSYKTIPEISKELGVDYIVSGYYQLEGDTIKVDVELVDALGKVVWSLPYEGEKGNVFEVQRGIASGILKRFSSTARIAGTPIPTRSLDAFAHVNKGHQLWWNIFATDSASIQPAIEQFEKAISIDSLYLDAWVALVEIESRAYTNMLTPQRVGVYPGLAALPESANAMLSRIDGRLKFIDAHFPVSAGTKLAHGLYTFLCLRDIDGATRMFTEVLEEDPENAVANKWISSLYKRNLDFANALYFCERFTTMSPDNIQGWVELAVTLECIGDSVNAFRSHVKSWELGWKIDWFLTYKGRLLGQWQHIPDAARNDAGESYELEKCILERDARRMIHIGESVGRYYYVALGYHLLDMRDSSRINARIELDNWGSIMSLWSTSSYALAGHTDIIVDRDESLPMFKDKLDACARMEGAITAYALLGNYAKATELLIGMAKKFPEYGNYFFLKSPEFDKIKKEYSPFNRAIAGLPKPKLIPLQKPIVLASMK